MTSHSKRERERAMYPRLDAAVPTLSASPSIPSKPKSTTRYPSKPRALWNVHNRIISGCAMSLRFSSIV